MNTPFVAIQRVEGGTQTLEGLSCQWVEPAEVKDVMGLAWPLAGGPWFSVFFQVAGDTADDSSLCAYDRLNIARVYARASTS